MAETWASFRLGFGLRNILTYCCLEFRRICIIGNRNHDLDIVGGGPPLELGLGLHHDLHPGVGVSLYHGLDPDQRLHVSVQS